MAAFKANTNKADTEKKTTFSVRNRSTIIIANREYHGSKGAKIELTEQEAKDKYSHQIEAIAVDSDKEIKDIADNKAIKKESVKKR